MNKLTYSARLFSEFMRFAKANKIYWLVPLIMILIVVSLLVIAGQASAPFIYTLF